MKLVFLGTAGYHPNENRQTACIAIPDIGLVLDAGTGLFRLRRYLRNNKNNKNDNLHLNILLTHFHLDHTAGLTYLYDVLRGRYDKVKVTVYGMNGIKSISKHLFSSALFPIRIEEHPFSFKLRKIKNKFSVEKAIVYTQNFEHKGGVVGYRVEHDGKTIVYITDTKAQLTEKSVNFASNADLLIHECYYLSHQKQLAEKNQHSYTTLVAKYAKKAKVKKLALFHFNPLEPRIQKFDVEARIIFPNTISSYDGLEVNV